jgi:hypothetical protein
MEPLTNPSRTWGGEGLVSIAKFMPWDMANGFTMVMHFFFR